MGIDEARNDDPICSIDHSSIIARYRDIGSDLADLAALDQHVRLREIADP